MTNSYYTSHWFMRARLAFIAIAAAIAAGCGSSDSGGGSSSPPPPPPTAQGALKPAATADEFEAALKSAFTTVTSPSTSTDLLGVSAPAANAAGNFSSTYTQDVNVDEFDAVRYDGEHLYVAPRRYVNCCFLTGTNAGSNPAAQPVDSIRILSADSTAATAAPLASIPLKPQVSVQGMYVADDTLFALTAEGFNGNFGPFWSDIAIWAPETFGYQVYDIQDRSQPTPITDVSIEGLFVDSRRVGNTIYIVSRYLPAVNNLIYAPTNAIDTAQNESLLASIALEDMLPEITIDGATQALVDPLKCFVPNDDAVSAYPVITSITAIPLDDPGSFENTCYNSEAYGAYVSESAVYMTQFIRAAAATPAATRIHKFALAGTAAEYRGSGDVPGLLWRGGQSDFRMSEANGDLRVFSSEFLQNNEDFVDHHLSVLREVPGSQELTVVGQLPNAASPDPIGKPNESLYGVRFLGDRAYAVTFERIDPLYVFDLSDPANPSIAGELEVEGFSDFLHPVNDDLLLGLGSGATGGVKLELFDVSDISAPLTRGEITIGQSGLAYSEARHNRYAFSYLAMASGVDRFTIPVTEFSIGSGTSTTGLHLFEVRDKATPDLASLIAVGEITPPNPDWVERNRAYLHDDAVFYVQDETVWSALWSTPTMLNGPY